MPPAAARMMPGKCSLAPVKAPRRWPKSCESSMSFGVALQLKGRNGFSRAGGVGVNRAGEHFFAGPRLAGDEHRHARRRDAARRGEERLHLFGEEERAGLLLGGAGRPERGAAALLLPRLLERQRRAADAEDVGEEHGLSRMLRGVGNQGQVLAFVNTREKQERRHHSRLSTGRLFGFR